MGFFKRKKKDSEEKQNLNKSSRWRHLQDNVAPKTKHLDGVTDVETQKVLPSGKRPDYHARTWIGDRVVGDSKNVQRLTKDHVDQVKGYIRETNAIRGFIVVRKTTEISQDVIEYAERNGVSISRMPVTSNAKRMGSIAGFDFFASGEKNREEVVTNKNETHNLGFGDSIPPRKSNIGSLFGSKNFGSNRKNTFHGSLFTLGRNSKPSRPQNPRPGNSGGYDSIFGLGGSSSSSSKKKSSSSGFDSMFGLDGGSKPRRSPRRSNPSGYDSMFGLGGSSGSTSRRKSSSSGFDSMFGLGGSSRSKRRKSNGIW